MAKRSRLKKGSLVELRDGSPLYFDEDRKPVFQAKVQQSKYKVCVLENGMGFYKSRIRLAVKGAKKGAKKCQKKK